MLTYLVYLVTSYAQSCAQTESKENFSLMLFAQISGPLCSLCLFTPNSPCTDVSYIVS